MLDDTENIMRTWRTGDVCSTLGVPFSTFRESLVNGDCPPRGPHLENLAEIAGKRGAHARFTFAGILRFLVARRLIELNFKGRVAFEIALTPVELGNMPEAWGDGPPVLKPRNYRAPGRIFAAGRTWLVVDPRRRDDLTGLPVHRVICTADPQFRRAESILTAPDEGKVERDPETLIILDLTALGHRLCAGLKVDPADYLITPEPGGGWG